MPSKTKRRPDAFTLIELLVVVAIIAILAALLLPALSSAKSFAKGTQCLGALKQYELGNLNYADSYNGWEVPAAYGYSGGSYTNVWYCYSYLELAFKSCIGLPLYASNQGAWPRALVCPDATLSPKPDSRGLVNFSNPFYPYGMNTQDLLWGDAFFGWRQTQVRNPSMKVNFADGLNWLLGTNGSYYSTNYAILGEAYSAAGATAYRHRLGANVAFHDGHAAHLTYRELQGKAELWRTGN